MKKIYNLSELQIGKIYYIDLPSEDVRPPLKLKGKLWSNSDEKSYISFGDLEYVNDKYNHLRFPNCKPLILNLYIINGLLYRIITHHLQKILFIKSFPEIHTPCNIYEPENEKILVNFIMRNKIINDPYFNYYNDGM